MGFTDAGHTGTLPRLALIATRPVKAAGLRSEPPPSLPSATGVTPAATDATAPPLEPPGVSAVFQGLRVMPWTKLLVWPRYPNSGVAVLPRTIAPAFRNRSTDGASARATLSFIVNEPYCAGRPATSIKSLTETGTP